MSAKNLPRLFAQNRQWASEKTALDPLFFEKLTGQQTPEYLWIGCSDSRVPANEIVNLLPGELFVHRNVANLVVHSDLNCLSVLQYAVEVLKVKHVIVTGHYGCGGVKAAWEELKFGLVDNWLRHVQDVKHQHQDCLNCLPSPSQQIDRLCELNVIEQVLNVGRTTIIRDAWEEGRELTLHGWVYSLADGLIRDLGVCASSHEELKETYTEAIHVRRSPTFSCSSLMPGQ
jgi:carbonic anhydrase